MDCVQPMLSTSASVAVLAVFYKQATSKSPLQYTIGLIIACCVLSMVVSAANGCLSSYHSNQK